mmetsp:Transcript_781/g.2531  ORF Transcript_781/g.2531 Transcript_781/m.2531 type:complete len:315 (+) Transcript_781:1875-2819(+)
MHFRSSIELRADIGDQHVGIVAVLIGFGKICQSEICNLDVEGPPTVAAEYVFGLDVSMHDVVAVQVSNSLEHCLHELRGSLLRKMPLCCNPVEKLASSDVLQNEVYLRLILENIVRLDDIRMLYGFDYFYFTPYILALTLIFALYDGLNGNLCTSFQVTSKIHLAKRTRSNHFAGFIEVLNVAGRRTPERFQPLFILILRLHSEHHNLAVLSDLKLHLPVPAVQQTPPDVELELLLSIFTHSAPQYSVCQFQVPSRRQPQKSLLLHPSTHLPPRAHGCDHSPFCCLGVGPEPPVPTFLRRYPLAAHSSREPQRL